MTSVIAVGTHPKRTDGYQALAFQPIICHPGLCRFDVDSPICWQPPSFDIPMEARIRPMAHLRHVPMLHRVPMDVIDMPVEVGLITDEMFSESMLPQGALVPFSAVRIHPFRSIESGLATLRDHPLDDTPTVGEILISGRQCPEGMHVVRQQPRSQTDGSNEAFRSLPAGPSAHRHR
jgi:hypothetical protein